MNYWWVNQKQTYKHEIPGCYMWSPKTKQNGDYNQFYENMRAVEPGDVVFSYYKGMIQKVGVVQGSAITGSKPADFKLTGSYWNSEGWYVPVTWFDVPSPFRPRDIFSQIQSTLPQKYSPLNQRSGDGLQNVYLAKVPENMAQVLLGAGEINLSNLLALPGALNGSTGDEALDDLIEKAVRNDTSIDETEKAAVISARRGQGKFRKNVAEIERKCRVSGVTDPKLLRASHIKPWRLCNNNQERLDGYNGFLLAPHIDHLFDQGYISFANDGTLLLSPRIDHLEYEKLGIRTDSVINVGTFTTQQQQYLDYHRKIHSFL
jgi:putative restriction endonuclease